ncbi:hypothetical protein GCM10027614_05990 [Micromonospora vulcania]
MPDRPAPLPGGVGVSRLRVYDTVALDGLVGGTPHVHLCCTEGYVVTDGEGAVQTLTATGFRETPCGRARSSGSSRAPCTAWSTGAG